MQNRIDDMMSCIFLFCVNADASLGVLVITVILSDDSSVGWCRGDVWCAGGGVWCEGGDVWCEGGGNIWCEGHDSSLESKRGNV